MMKISFVVKALRFSQRGGEWKWSKTKSVEIITTVFPSLVH